MEMRLRKRLHTPNQGGPICISLSPLSCLYILTLSVRPYWIYPMRGKRCFVLEHSQSQSLFHEILNQTQASLYSFECIFHGDYKFSIKIQQFWNIWQILCTFRVCRLLTSRTLVVLRVWWRHRRNLKCIFKSCYLRDYGSLREAEW